MKTKRKQTAQLINVNRHCSVNMYADDTAIYLGSQTALNIYLNQDLERLAEWLVDNNLVLNVAKTKSLLFTV